MSQLAKHFLKMKEEGVKMNSSDYASKLEVEGNIIARPVVESNSRTSLQIIAK